MKSNLLVNLLSLKSNFFVDKSNSSFESISALVSVEDSHKEPKYYKYYRIVSKLIAKVIDIDELVEE